ncbi:hypothetical protein ACYOEI_19095, partial [Singulisphaera rosea]
MLTGSGRAANLNRVGGSKKNPPCESPFACEDPRSKPLASTRCGRSGSLAPGAFRFATLRGRDEMRRRWLWLGSAVVVVGLAL